jgi:hypothetical protein
VLLSTSRGSAWVVNACKARNSVMHGLSRAALTPSSTIVTRLMPSLISSQVSASSPAAIAMPAVAPKVKKASTPAPAATPIATACTTPTMPLMTPRMPDTTSITALTDARLLASVS